MAWVIVALSLTNIVTLSLLIKARIDTKKVIVNEKLVKAWLRVHHDIQSASGAAISIKRVNASDMLVFPIEGE